MLHDSNRPLRLAFYPSLGPERTGGTHKSLRASIPSCRVGSPPVRLSSLQWSIPHKERILVKQDKTRACGGWYNGQTTASNSSGQKEYSNSGNAGIGVGIFNLTGTYTADTNNQNGQRGDTFDTSLGVGGALGIGASVDYSIQVGIRTTITTGGEDDQN